MTVSNEDLLMEMQRVGALIRRSHAGHKGHGHHRGHHPEHEMAPSDGPRCSHAHGGPDAPAGHPHEHGHGGHHHGHGGKCPHKGAGKHGQARILAMLEVRDGIPQKDLAFLLGIRPQSLTIALERLEAEGLIERKQDEDDKRARLVCITEAGKAKAAEQSEERSKHADDLFAVLSEDEKDQLAAILGKLADSIEDDMRAR